ncbi:MAG: hypothetical protein AB8B83_06565 [Bdellovibrionales bacterium]
MKNVAFLFATLGAAVALNGCKTVMDPTFVQSGYTYHHKEYKAPPADTAWQIGYDYTRAQNASVLNEWRDVAADLTNKIEAITPLATKPVFLSSPTYLDNAFTLSLDHALREEFRSRGYRLAKIPHEDTIKLQISSYDPAYTNVMRSYKLNDEDQVDLPEPPAEIRRNLVLKVDGMIDGNFATIIEDPYILPLYGYQDEQLYFPLGQNIAEVWR